MVKRRVVLVLGSLWDLVRFFLVLSLLSQMLRAAGGGAGTVPWLLLAGTGNLLVPAGALLYIVFPDRYAGLLGLLRLGKALCVFSFILLAVSGSLSAAGGTELLRIGSRVVPASTAALGFVVLDAAFLLVLLLETRPAGQARAGQAAAGGLPGTEMKDPR